MRWDFWPASTWQAPSSLPFPGQAELKRRCWSPPLTELLRDSPKLPSETRSCGSGAREWLEFPARLLPLRSAGSAGSMCGQVPGQGSLPLAPSAERLGMEKLPEQWRIPSMGFLCQGCCSGCGLLHARAPHRARSLPLGCACPGAIHGHSSPTSAAVLGWLPASMAAQTWGKAPPVASIRLLPTAVGALCTQPCPKSALLTNSLLTGTWGLGHAQLHNQIFISAEG